MAPAIFIAGWYDGLTQHEIGQHIYDCFKPDQKLTDTLYDAMSAYSKGDVATADKLMTDTESLYKTALNGCPRE